MARVKRGKTSNKKHKKILKAAKGYIGRRKNTIRVAKQSVERSLQYSYRDRRRKKEILDLYGYRESTLGLEQKD